MKKVKKMEERKIKKQLDIVVLGQIRLKAFSNSEKKTDKHPDFKGNGVAVWINEMKEKEVYSHEL